MARRVIMKHPRRRRRKKAKGVATKMSQLPDDLVIEILARLPTKSLYRFQCVSKLWNSFISHVPSIRTILLPISGFFFNVDFFYNVDYAIFKNIFFYLPISSRRDFEEAFQSLMLLDYTFSIIHSCNGLLLFTARAKWWSVEEYERRGFYFVWNPATMEHVALPKPPNKLISGRYCFLAYNPLQSPHYKVVRFNFSAYLGVVEIYSSMTGSWATFTPPREPPLGWYPMSVFLKGALHMLSQYYLVRFDVDKESFHTIMLPRETTHDTQCTCIGESRGHLFYVASECSAQGELRIYMLDEEHTWQILHKISTKVLAPRHKPLLDLRPITFHPQAEVLYLSVPRKILSYHPSSGRVEVVREVTEYEYVAEWWEVFSIIPCLESINPLGGKFINTSAI